MDRIIQQHTSVARAKLLEKAKQKNNPVEVEKPWQGLLFVGNRHETVPLRLLTDRYLSPRAKIAWQMIKLNAYQYQGSVFPSYEELAMWLSDRAFQDKPVSRKIVSQTLLLLRLTRWLTLCETVRNDKGQVLGNVYIMNDEPLSLTDSLQLNSDYLRLIEKAAKHNDALVRDVATAIIDEILDEKNQLSHLVSHIAVIQTRMAQQGKSLPIGKPVTELNEQATQVMSQTKQYLLSSNMELSGKSRELSDKSLETLSSNMELSQEKVANPLNLLAVPNRNSVSTVQYSTKYSKYSTGTLSEDVSTTLGKLGLSKLEQQQLAQAMLVLDVDTQKAILLEAEQRIQSGSVKRPAGYLFSLIKKAQSGAFNPYFQYKAQQIETERHQATSVTRASAKRILPEKTVHRSTEKQQHGLAMIRQLAQSISLDLNQSVSSGNN